MPKLHAGKEILTAFTESLRRIMKILAYNEQPGVEFVTSFQASSKRHAQGRPARFKQTTKTPGTRASVPLVR